MYNEIGEPYTKIKYTIKSCKFAKNNQTNQNQINKMIAKELQELDKVRKKYNLTQKQMSELVGYKQQQGYERAIKKTLRLSNDRLERLQIYFEITTTIKFKPKPEFLKLINKDIPFANQEKPNDNE